MPSWYSALIGTILALIGAGCVYCVIHAMFIYPRQFKDIKIDED